MTNEQRILTIEDKLTHAFQPTQLSVIDESHKHVGHAGAKSGRGHFKIRIAADCFNGKNELQVHRAIYKALDDLMTTDIHALSIELIP